MSDVFISYSRVDEAFAKRLYAAIESCKREAWIDLQKIPPTAEWWRAIERGIEGANTFVFILSPNSLASEICQAEVTHAVRYNKRLIPIVCQEGKPDPNSDAHQALQKLNWIFFCREDSFEQAFQKLIEAVDTDLEHVQEHTRLLERALEWGSTGQSDSKLLRGDDLKTAEQWLQTSKLKEPLPNKQQQDYISESRKVEDALIADNKLRTRILRITIIGAVVLSFAAFHGVRQSQNKQQIALEVTRLEREGDAAIKRFQFDQLGGLISVMNAGDDLQQLMKKESTREYLAANPAYGLKTLLDMVSNQKLLSHYGANVNAELSPQGDRILYSGPQKLDNPLSSKLPL